MYCNKRDQNYNSYYYSQSVLYQGPSPLIPFLLVISLGLLICWESMLEYYEMLFEFKENIEGLQETLPIALVIIICVFVLSCGFMCDTFFAVAPIAALLLIFLLQNEVLCVLVLLLVISFLAIMGSSYQSQNGGNWNWNWSRQAYQSKREEVGERRKSDLPFELTLGQLCYLMMVGCLIACTVFSEDQNIWWTCMALLLACVLYFNFSGRGNREWIL